MGLCMSVEEKEGKQRSYEIDKLIEEDSRKFRKECKILLLGTSQRVHLSSLCFPATFLYRHTYPRIKPF